MADCVDEFLDFIRGAELVIHNAAFDVGFIDHELALLGRSERVADILDALTKRYGITNFNRELHGALLDSEILAQVYLSMTGGQSGLSFSPQKTAQTEVETGSAGRSAKYVIAEVPLSEEEIALHKQYFS